MGRDGEGKPFASYLTFGCITKISCWYEVVTILGRWGGGWGWGFRSIWSHVNALYFLTMPHCLDESGENEKCNRLSLTIYALITSVRNTNVSCNHNNLPVRGGDSRRSRVLGLSTIFLKIC